MISKNDCWKESSSKSILESHPHSDQNTKPVEDWDDETGSCDSSNSFYQCISSDTLKDIQDIDKDSVSSTSGIGMCTLSTEENRKTGEAEKHVHYNEQRFFKNKASEKVIKIANNRRKFRKILSEVGQEEDKMYEMIEDMYNKRISRCPVLAKRVAVEQLSGSQTLNCILRQNDALKSVINGLHKEIALKEHYKRFDYACYSFADLTESKLKSNKVQHGSKCFQLIQGIQDIIETPKIETIFFYGYREYNTEDIERTVCEYYTLQPVGYINLGKMCEIRLVLSDMEELAVELRHGDIIILNPENTQLCHSIKWDETGHEQSHDGASRLLALFLTKPE